MRVKRARLLRNQSRTQPSEAATAEKLERAKAFATIFSAVAIPIVLTVSGYFIQRQLADDGLKKDYVGIATGILKENPSSQEPELRAWAIKVLDENAPIPFSKRAKEGLLTGHPVVIAGPAIPGPPEDCMKRPKKRSLYSEFDQLAKDMPNAEVNKAVELLLAFANSVVKQERDTQLTLARFDCLREWAQAVEQMDINYRNQTGAPSSKSIFESLRKEQEASAKAASAATTSTLDRPTTVRKNQ